MDAGYTLGATYVACSEGESGSGPFYPSLHGYKCQYLSPKASSFFLQSQSKTSG